MAGLEDVREVRVETPFGDPSDVVRVGVLEGHRVAFLARHGRQHRLLPTEINYRANVYALKALGVRRLLSASAVGSMREHVHPRHVVVPDQFIDRTRHRTDTFFGDGVVAHVSLADPVCPVVRQALRAAAEERKATVHDGGTYLCMEGPQFSTRAESRLYRSWGVDVIGMTNLQEARLAREAEICYATLALVTDFDCWHEDEDDVTVEALLQILRDNAALATETLRTAILRLAGAPDGGCACGDALKYAIITPREAIPEETRRRLSAILGRYLDASA
jgi:5'-methylthioadenosine phosphorylase